MSYDCDYQWSQASYCAAIDVGYGLTTSYSDVGV